MKRKRGGRKRIQVVQIGQRVPGTKVIARAYWDFIATTQDLTGEGVNVSEDPLANPDMAAEKSPYNRRLTERGEAQLQAIQETMSGLTEQQRRILTLMHEGVWVERGKTEEELTHEFATSTEELDGEGEWITTVGERLHTEQAIADELGISRDNVHMQLSRIKTKVRKRYEKLMTDED